MSKYLKVTVIDDYDINRPCILDAESILLILDIETFREIQFKRVNSEYIRVKETMAELAEALSQ
jgi:hypothetical protein